MLSGVVAHLDTNERQGTLRNFFNSIYGDSSGYVAIVTKSESGALDSERWLQYPQDLDFMVRYTELRKDEDVYCSVALFTEKARTMNDAGSVANVLYADGDECPPSVLWLKPSITVQTSEGHWHYWWILDEEVPASVASSWSRRIYNAHAADKMDNGWIQSKILRVPGTSNTKRDTPELVVAEYGDIVYTLQDVEAKYGSIPVVPSVEVDTRDLPAPVSRDRLIELEEVVDRNGLTDLYAEKPREGQSWTERMFRLELDLFRAGLTAEEVFSLVLEAPVNKFNPDAAGQLTQTGVPIPRRGNWQETTWRDVLKAEAEFLVLENVEREEQIAPTTAKVEFLTDDERELIRDNPTFVDEYQKWALGKSPDSAPTYHRSLAYSVLSAAFSDRVCTRARWGTMFPNMWTMVLGDSTSTRKTTSKNYAVKIIRGIESAEGIQIDIGSDVTQEAVVQALGPRDKQVSMIHTDEIAKFFEENMVKVYRQGTVQTFTQLYDGEVPVVLRATKGSGNRQRSTTRFIFLGVGIRSKVANILTKEFFESGFLSRFVWSIADPAPYSREQSNWDQGDDDDEDIDKITYDVDMAAIVSDLVGRRTHHDPALPTMYKFEPDALARFNKFVGTMLDSAHGSPDWDVLRPASERLRDSVVKAATLLAAYYGDKAINEFHVLHAIAQGESWYNDMRRMIAEVSTNSFSRLCQDVERFIASGDGGQKLESSIYKKFGFKPSEYSEVIQTLQKQGLVRYVQGSRQKLEVYM